MMKCHRIISPLIAVYLGTQVGCATAGKNIARYPKNQTLAEARFDPNYVYQIKMKGSETRYQASGDRIEKREGSVAIRTSEGFSEIPSNRIERIEAKSKEPTGSHALLGMGIGAGVGALAVGLGGGLGAKCVGGEECDPVFGSKAGDVMMFGLSGAVIGGLIGLGIGYVIPKKSKVTIVPTVSQTSSETRAGVGLSLPF